MAQGPFDGQRVPGRGMKDVNNDYGKCLYKGLKTLHAKGGYNI